LLRLVQVGEALPDSRSLFRVRSGRCNGRRARSRRCDTRQRDMPSGSSPGTALTLRCQILAAGSIIEATPTPRKLTGQGQLCCGKRTGTVVAVLPTGNAGPPAAPGCYGRGSCHCRSRSAPAKTDTVVLTSLGLVTERQRRQLGDRSGAVVLDGSREHVAIARRPDAALLVTNKNVNASTILFISIPS